MGLQASSSLEEKGNILAGPYHPSFGHLVFSSLFLDRAIKTLKTKKTKKKNVTIFVHNKNISTMRGIKNSNIKILKKMFGLEEIQVKTDSKIKCCEIII